MLLTRAMKSSLRVVVGRLDLQGIVRGLRRRIFESFLGRDMSRGYTRLGLGGGVDVGVGVAFMTRYVTGVRRSAATRSSELLHRRKTTTLLYHPLPPSPLLPIPSPSSQDSVEDTRPRCRSSTIPSPRPCRVRIPPTTPLPTCSTKAQTASRKRKTDQSYDYTQVNARKQGAFSHPLSTLDKPSDLIKSSPHPSSPMRRALRSSPC